MTRRPCSQPSRCSTPRAKAISKSKRCAGTSRPRGKSLRRFRIEFNTKETQDFIEFATNKDPNATVIYYEDYLSRLYGFVDKHLENVMKGYATFQAKK
jgi:hypothetical protein